MGEGLQRTAGPQWFRGAVFFISTSLLGSSSQMPLEITRSFIQNQDGTYEPFKCPKVEVESIPETYGRLEKQPVLRPLELKTFLKVGEVIVGGDSSPTLPADRSE